jgi:EAL domain-containing protein (putative c-di-GMP-specific phosphodiesterase class I)
MQAITVEAGFELWFQPIYRVATKSFTNMEVLLRLKEKDGSYISPGEFIPIAENTGQIIPITEFVIKETCRILSDCNELSSMKVSINLPMIQLTDPSFEKKLDEIVGRYGISHDRINFEFTERVILDDLNVAEKNMRRLARSGYSFYLDDFGIGYSNFNCVLRLPLRTIKLDMSLTSTTKRLSENFGIVNVLTDLFHNMGLTVVAEGAETSEQVQLLKLYGVDGIQGYYFARPMPLEKLIKFLEENNH